MSDFNTAEADVSDDTRTLYLDGSFSRQIRSLLYHTYRDDPVYQSLFESERTGYDQRIRACTRELASGYFSENFPVVGVVKNDRLIATAFVAKSSANTEFADRFFWRCKMILTVGYGCTEKYLAFLKSIYGLLPEGAHYYLPLIGVHPDFQHQGHGRHLLDAVHNLCDLDQQSQGIGLNTSNPEMLPFFESMGYRHAGQFAVNEGVRETVMFRDK